MQRLIDYTLTTVFLITLVININSNNTITSNINAITAAILISWIIYKNNDNNEDCV
jgi:hypothetical protein